MRKKAMATHEFFMLDQGPTRDIRIACGGVEPARILRSVRRRIFTVLWRGLYEATVENADVAPQPEDTGCIRVHLLDAGIEAWLAGSADLVAARCISCGSRRITLPVEHPEGALRDNSRSLDIYMHVPLASELITGTLSHLESTWTSHCLRCPSERRHRSKVAG